MSTRCDGLWFQYGQMMNRADELLKLYERTVDRAETVRKDWDAASREECEPAPVSPAQNGEGGDEE